MRWLKYKIRKVVFSKQPLREVHKSRLRYSVIQYNARGKRKVLLFIVACLNLQ